MEYALSRCRKQGAIRRCFIFLQGICRHGLGLDLHPSPLNPNLRDIAIFKVRQIHRSDRCRYDVANCRTALLTRRRTKAGDGCAGFPKLSNHHDPPTASSKSRPRPVCGFSRPASRSASQKVTWLAVKTVLPRRFSSSVRKATVWSAVSGIRTASASEWSFANAKRKASSFFTCPTSPRPDPQTTHGKNLHCFFFEKRAKRS